MGSCSNAGQGLEPGEDRDPETSGMQPCQPLSDLSPRSVGEFPEVCYL